MRQATCKRMEMVMEKGKETFLLIGFLPIVPKRLDCSCLCKLENHPRSRGISLPLMHPSYLCHWSTLGFSLFPDLSHFKCMSSDSKTAKRFAHITAEFLVGVLGSPRQERNSSNPCFRLLSLFCEVGVVSKYCGKGAQNHRDKCLFSMPWHCTWRIL